MHFFCTGNILTLEFDHNCPYNYHRLYKTGTTTAIWLLSPLPRRPVLPALSNVVDEEKEHMTERMIFFLATESSNDRMKDRGAEQGRERIGRGGGRY
jgi:hypothetical protein